MTATKATHETELRQMVAYHDMEKRLEAQYPGRWVVLHNCQLVGDYGSYDEATAAAQGKHLDLPDCFIQKVGAEPPPIG